MNLREPCTLIHTNSHSHTRAPSSNSFVRIHALHKIVCNLFIRGAPNIFTATKARSNSLFVILEAFYVEMSYVDVFAVNGWPRSKKLLFIIIFSLVLFLSLLFGFTNVLGALYTNSRKKQNCNKLLHARSENRTVPWISLFALDKLARTFDVGKRN